MTPKQQRTHAAMLDWLKAKNAPGARMVTDVKGWVALKASCSRRTAAARVQSVLKTMAETPDEHPGTTFKRWLDQHRSN